MISISMSMQLNRGKQITKNLNQIIIKPHHINNPMTAIFKGLFKWSLEITGASIIWYNYQTYERQQKIIGVYSSFRNSIRFTKCLYGLSKDFSQYQQNSSPESLATFKESTAKRLQQLCEENLGAYARIGQVLSGYTDIIPSEYAKQFNKLFDKPLEGLPYTDVKIALTSIFQKDTKQIFDGFQTKPLSVGLFTQSHKSVLLQNYREAVVKILLPSTKVQVDYDIWFINKVKDYVVNYLKKNNIKEDSYKLFIDTLDSAEKVIRDEINFENELVNADKNKQLMYERNSAFYVPYYFSKYCNNNVIIRQFIEGVHVNDIKGLKQLGVTPEVAFAYVLSEVHHLMKKYHQISGSLHPSNIMIRKYIKPYRTATQTDSEIVKEEQRTTKSKQKRAAIIHPPYQIIFLSQNNFQEIPTEVTDDITSYWSNLKKEKKKVLPSVESFYQRLPKYQQLKPNKSLLMSQRYYLYEPLLKLYESIKKTD